MVILIAGASHTGKTLLAQRLLKKYGFPYLSIDHLKMGLIRSGQTELTPEDDEELTPYLWSIVKEIIKTAIENGQNLTVEGIYIPFDWKKDFDCNYLCHIKYICLVMSERYIRESFNSIKSYENVIEMRLESDFSLKKALEDNQRVLDACIANKADYLLIDKEYSVDFEI